MIYFCADDYGISVESNHHIENCLKNSVLNKVSVLPNGEISDFNKNLPGEGKTLSLHINLVEGKPLSNPDDINVLVSEDGCFKYSFIGLFLKSISSKKKDFEKAIYKELKSQIEFWNREMGNGDAILIDSHQHTHMIPLVFKTLMRVIKDEGIKVDYIRIPAEPIFPYLLTPSLYFSYSIKGVVKQWILKFFSLINKNELKKSKIDYGYFMGVMFSGKLDEQKINKILPHYIKIAEKNKRSIEIGFHPGYFDNEEMTFGIRGGFKKFYLSPWRKKEHDTLMNFKI